VARVYDKIVAEQAGSSGWQHQSQLGDDFLGTRKTIAKAFGFDDAARPDRHLFFRVESC